MIASLKKYLGKNYKIIKDNFLGIENHFYQKSYAQEGEDLIMNDLLKDVKNGFYVDVGAHHPFRFSNTYVFYKKGWNGINIDPTPGSMKLFEKYRSRDINLEIAISNNGKKSRDFFIFNDSALNSFSKKLSEARANGGTYKIERIIKIKQDKLANVLQKYLSSNKQNKIDFMSVDVEGDELDVLSSNDWNCFKPKYVMVEIIEKVEEMLRDKVYQYMKEMKYICIAKTVRTAIFKAND